MALLARTSVYGSGVCVLLGGTVFGSVVRWFGSVVGGVCMCRCVAVGRVGEVGLSGRDGDNGSVSVLVLHEDLGRVSMHSCRAAPKD